MHRKIHAWECKFKFINKYFYFTLPYTLPLRARQLAVSPKELLRGRTAKALQPRMQSRVFVPLAIETLVSITFKELIFLFEFGDRLTDCHRWSPAKHRSRFSEHQSLYSVSTRFDSRVLSPNLRRSNFSICFEYAVSILPRIL